MKTAAKKSDGQQQYLLIAIKGTGHHQIAAGPAVIGIIISKRGELSKLQ